MIAAMLGTAETGVYALSYNLGMTVSLVFVAISQAWVPYYYALMREERYEEHDRQLELVIRVICVCGLLVGVVGAEVARPLIGPAFHGGLNLVGIVAVSYVWRGLGQAYSRNFQFAKRTALSSAVFIVAAIVNIVLNWIFLPLWGIAAAAYTTLFSFIVMLALAWLINRQVVRLHAIAVRRWIAPVALVCLAVGLSTYLDFAGVSTGLRIGLKLAIAITMLPIVVGRNAVQAVRSWRSTRA
jgi:O-antigen/teichoic acid export membrane protein